MDTTTATRTHREPWNKGKLVGQKAPFKLKDIWALRVRLQMQSRVRELALLNLGIDSKLRGCDLIALKVRDVRHGKSLGTPCQTTRAPRSGKLPPNKNEQGGSPMARRKKSSVADDLVDLIALLPWWAGVLLALLSYVLLHRVAMQPVVVGTGSLPLQSLWKGAATAGQYIAPVLCLAGAGLSAWRRKARKALVADVAQTQASDALDGMSWREFEVLVGEGFRLQGYQVLETGGGGPDGGVDLVLSKPGKNGSEKFLVQCKQWRALKVGVDVVRELYGVMAAKGAAGGFVVTSGRFTDEAKAFASGRNVSLVDGPRLHGLIRQAQASSKSPSAGRTPAPAVPPAVPPAEAPVLADPPACPACAKPMVQRTAKRGANAGVGFWGCTGYPACRGTRAIG